MSKWISLDESEAQHKTSGRQSPRDRLVEHGERLKTMLLEQRIRKATADATNAELRTEDQRQSIIDGALAEHDTALLERAHGAVANFFILGSGLVFASCIGGIGIFCLLLIVAILGSILSSMFK